MPESDYIIIPEPAHTDPAAMRGKRLFGASVVVILGSWSLAFFISLLTISQVNFSFAALFSSIPPTALMAGELFWIGAFMFVPAWFGRRQWQHPDEPRPRIKWKTLAVVFWVIPIVWGAGVLAGYLPILSLFILPPIHILSIAIPLIWYIAIGGRDLKDAKTTRVLGVFSVSFLMTPMLILIFELIIGAVTVIVGFSTLLNQPGFLDELMRLAEQIQLTDPTLDTFMPFAEKYLIQPSIVGTGIFFIAVLVPLLEEFLKPLALWFLKRETLTPADGFIFGMISGAGFALFESLAINGTGTDWLFLVMARMGTSLIHILTTGLTGWGLVLAWNQRKYGRLVLHYFIAVSIHGLWNGMTGLMIASELPGYTLISDSIPWPAIAVTTLFTLGIGAFIALLWLNRQFKTDLAMNHLQPVRAVFTPVEPPLEFNLPEDAWTTTNDPDNPSDN